MSNQINQLLDIFKKKEILDQNTYINYITQFVNYYKPENVENNNRIYKIYLDVINNIIDNNITSVRTIIQLIRLTKIGIYSITFNSIQYWTDRGHTEEEAKIQNKLSNSTNSLNYICKKYNCTEEDGKKIQKTRGELNQKTLNKRSKEEILKINYSKGKSVRKCDLLLKINPDTNLNYTEEEIHLLWKKRYGWNKGKKLTKEQKSNNNCTIEFYLNRGFILEEAQKQLQERQTTFSLEKCIQKYGEENGLIRWQQRQDKWLKTLDEKSPEEKLEILIKKIKRPNFWSVESINFFELLINYIDIHLPENNLTFNYKNNEYYINNSGKFYLYDFTITELNIIIEYNGSHVHPNPNMDQDKWNAWKNSFTKENADECYKKDLHKNNSAIDRGFDLIVVWDNDIKKIENKNKTIENLFSIIKNKYNKKQTNEN